MNSLYQINKGINKPVEFKGLKAQYIWHLGAGLLGLLILFTIMYITGLNTFLCLAITVAGGVALFAYVYRMSKKYGEYGMMKKIARRSIPKVIKANSRSVFIKIKK